MKTRHCRFCMHKAMREAQRTQVDDGIKRGKSSPTSSLQPSDPSSPISSSRKAPHWDYCPLDLFSIDRQRRCRAVGELVKSWIATHGTGNNFRIFVSGKALIPSFGDGETTVGIRDPASGSSAGKVFLAASASEEGPVEAGLIFNDTDRNCLCDAIVDTLDLHGVLPQLRALQQTFDPLGIEELGRLSGRSVKSSIPADSMALDEALLKDPSFQELDGVTEFWSRERRDLQETSRGNDAAQQELNVPKPNQKSDLRALLVSHGISAIFKDCSIVIRFPGALASSQTETNALSNLALDPLAAVVKLIDLDLKPLRKANKWYELDDQIWRSHAERMGGFGEDRGDPPRLSRDCCM